MLWVLGGELWFCAARIRAPLGFVLSFDDWQHSLGQTQALASTCSSVRPWAAAYVSPDAGQIASPRNQQRARLLLYLPQPPTALRCFWGGDNWVGFYWRSKWAAPACGVVRLGQLTQSPQSYRTTGPHTTVTPDVLTCSAKAAAQKWKRLPNHPPSARGSPRRMREVKEEPRSMSIARRTALQTRWGTRTQPPWAASGAAIQS